MSVTSSAGVVPSLPPRQIASGQCKAFCLGCQARRNGAGAWAIVADEAIQGGLADGLIGTAPRGFDCPWRSTTRPQAQSICKWFVGSHENRGLTRCGSRSVPAETGVDRPREPVRRGNPDFHFALENSDLNLYLGLVPLNSMTDRRWPPGAAWIRHSSTSRMADRYEK